MIVRKYTIEAPANKNHEHEIIKCTPEYLITVQETHNLHRNKNGLEDLLFYTLFHNNPQNHAMVSTIPIAFFLWHLLI